MLDQATPPELDGRLSVWATAFCFTLAETTASSGVRSGSESLSDIFLPTKNFSVFGSAYCVTGNSSVEVTVLDNRFQNQILNIIRYRPIHRTLPDDRLQSRKTSRFWW